MTPNRAKRWLPLLLPLGVVALVAVFIGFRKSAPPTPLPAGPLPRLVLRQANFPCGVALSLNGAVLAVGEGTNDVYRPRERQPVFTDLYDAHTGALLRRLPADYRVDNVALSPDGWTIAVQNFPGDLCTRDVRTGRLLHKINASADYVAFSPDGRTLATSGYGLQLWDVATGRLKRTLIPPRKPRPPDAYPSDCNIAFSPDGRLLAYASDLYQPLRDTRPSRQWGEQPQIWDVGSGRLVLTLPGTFTTALAFSRDGRSLLCVQTKRRGTSPPMTLRRMNVGTGRMEWSQPHDDLEWTINSLASSRNSTALACQTYDHKIILVNEKTGALLQRMEPPGSDPHKDVSWSNHSGLAFSGDGRTLVSRGGGGNAVWVWDISAFR